VSRAKGPIILLWS